MFTSNTFSNSRFRTTSGTQAIYNWFGGFKRNAARRIETSSQGVEIRRPLRTTIETVRVRDDPRDGGKTLNMQERLMFFFCVLLRAAVILTFPTPYSSNVNTISLNVTKRGIVVCAGAGNDMLDKVLVMIYQLKVFWKTSLGLSIIHCDEFNLKAEATVASMFPAVSFTNICDPRLKFVLGMRRKYALKKLRGFFCKVAAVIESPFVETMIMDLDVLWLNSPDLLFEAEGYIDTGALFFRDRIIFEEAFDLPFQKTLMNLFEHQMNITINIRTSNEILYATNNNSMFWWPFIHKKFSRSLEHYQESSIVLIDRFRHAETLRVLLSLLPIFSIGWGEKEIFWIAATIAKKRFAFERFLCGGYGDCGFIMHFDPRQISGEPDPFFLNAEYLLEGMHYIGEFLQTEVTNPILVTDNLRLSDEDPWKRVTKKGCSCPHTSCRKSMDYLSRLILHMQWVTLIQARLRKNHTCVPVSVGVLRMVNQMAKSILVPNLCYFTGCPSVLPMLITHGVEQINSKTNTVCIPFQI